MRNHLVRASVLLVILAAAHGCLAQQAEVQTLKTDWCEMTVPASILVGETMTATIKLTGLEGKVFLTCDLVNQDNQMVKWGGPPKEATVGSETVFPLLVRDVPNLSTVHTMLGAFRNAGDKWEDALKTAVGPTVKIAGRHPIVDLTYKKSWIAVDATNGGKPLTSGDQIQVVVDYYLDPADHWQKTTLYIWGTGPYIENPDGKYALKRGHIGYPGLAARVDLTEPGRGQHVFTFKVPQDLDLVRKHNPILFITTFRNAFGETFPWEVRANTSFVRKRGFFELETGVPGNLFTYSQPVQIGVRLKNVTKPGEAKTLRYVVHDTTGAIAAEGTRDFVVEKDGQQILLDLDLARRGVFGLEVEVPGWERRVTSFARIPDVQAVTGGQPTRFGMTTHYDAPDEEVWQVAQRLGMSWCRRFTRWYQLQPGPELYRLDSLAAELELAAKYGVREWLCIGDPPPYAFPGKPEIISYRPFDCNWDAWQEMVKTVTTRLKGKLYGWEWLNEINPGSDPDPVGVYAKMVRLGAETAKAIDPGITSILAGGLYPRNYRMAVLGAGVGQYIDALPVHYQNGDGVLEARQDLESVNADGVGVWEDESGRGINAWGVPLAEDLQNVEQADWILRQWPDELAAGCERIMYFGGSGNATGGFDYLMDDLGPRPAAATLAVLASKLHGAKPLGVFLLGRGGLFHLFERDGKAVALGSTYEEGGETVGLQVGGATVTLTDYQGNETVVPATNGRAALQLGRVPYFIEGADLDVLKTYVTPEIHVARVGAGTSANVAVARRMAPRVSMMQGGQGRLALQLRNLYDRPLTTTVRLELPEGWPTPAPVTIALRPGAEEVRQVAVPIPADAAASDYTVKALFGFDWSKLPRVEKPLVLSVISPDMLGNLLPNGDFETPDAAGTGPEGYAVNGKTKLWASTEGMPELGLGKHVLRFQSSSDWEHCGSSAALRGGQTYLYTAWIRNENMGAGSNMTQHLADGSVIRLYDVQVFTAGENCPNWQVFTTRKQMPEGTQTVDFTPVVRGAGWAMFDNLRVTIFEGTDFAAEAFRAPTAPTVDGNLGDWPKKCPIPLIGKNQLTPRAGEYAWTPANLSGVAYLMWDDSNLYVAVEVRDDVHHPTGTGQQLGDAFTAGDCVILAIDPTRRGPDAASRAFEYILSAAVPGGGSGRFTLLRPAEHSGGRPSGHLFRDSSIYDMAVATGAGTCTYELRIPLSELGIPGSLGTKIGLSVQLNDNDGKGPAGQMNWGGGLIPSWSANDFGVVTLVE